MRLKSLILYASKQTFLLEFAQKTLDPMVDSYIHADFSRFQKENQGLFHSRQRGKNHSFFHAQRLGLCAFYPRELSLF